MGNWVDRQGLHEGYTRKEEVSAGETSVVKIPFGSLLTVTAIPGEYGSAGVQFSTSADAEVVAETATWQDWPSGTVTTIKTDRVLGPITALKFIATTADAVFELVI